MRNTEQLDHLCDLFNQLVNQYGQLEKELHTCAAGTPLHLSDTHTIVAIGKNVDINISTLARLQGVSRSAVSQMVHKLVERGFVQKTTSPQTENEVVLSLTEAGEAIYHLHEQQHRWLNQRLTTVFDQYPDDMIDKLTALCVQIQGIWEEMPKNAPFCEKDGGRV